MLLAASMVGALQASPAAADIYMHEQDDGVIAFTDYRPNGKKKVEVFLRSAAPAKVLRKTAVVKTSDWDSLIVQMARKYAVEPALVKAVIHTESNFDPYAVSRAGAEGLMQLMPATALEMQVYDSFNPEANVDGGVRYLRRMLDKFKGNMRLSLAAYNAGPTAVDKYGDIPPFEETRNYVRKVLDLYERYRELHP